MQKKTTKKNKNTVTKKNIADSVKMVEDILTEASDGFYISVKKSKSRKKPLHSKITNVNREFVLLSVLKALDMDADDLAMFCISQVIKK